MEVREWGIKSISCLVYNVVIVIPWDIYYDEDTQLSQDDIDKIVNTMGGVKHPTKNLYEGVLELNSENEFNGAKFEIENNISSENQHGSYYPETCEVNFDDMTISLT
jgi:predicted RNA methylase